MVIDRHLQSDPTVALLAREWVKRNRPRFARDACKISAGINLFSIGVEALILAPDHLPSYALAHAVLALVAGASWLALRFSRPHRRLEQKVASWCLVSPAAGLLVAYAFFFLLRHEAYLVTIATSYAAVGFFGSLYLHRFWREQYLHGLVNVACLCLLFVVLSEQRIVVSALFSLQFLTVVTMHLFRREFFGSAYERFKGYQALLPLSVATNLVVAPEEALDHAFAPAPRYTICLCSDWRNFQGLAAAWDPEKLSHAIAAYYDLVCERLARHVPDDCYYFDWTADELFIVFFAEPGKEEELRDAVMTFVYELSTLVHERATEWFGTAFRYDVGLAAGEALVGIVGPKLRRKTTVIGRVPGVAKRFESEAKRLRSTCSQNDRPLVVMDTSLAPAAERSAYLDPSGFRRTVAVGKDVENQDCVTWQTPLTGGYRSVA